VLSTLSLANKYIYKTKLTVTTSCNLGCDYCFVKKTNEMMAESTAKKAVDLLLGSRGEHKLLSIYGGEPLLNFELIRTVIIYATAKARAMNKRLTANLCTNAVLIERRHLDFFRKYNIKLIISLAGSKYTHDKFRHTGLGGGTYDLVKAKLSGIFENLPRENIGASLCVFPATAHRLRRELKHLLQLGFNHVNFEIIREYQNWSEARIRGAVLGLKDIISRVLASIVKGKHIFINPVCWEIKYANISRSLCPFNYSLEVYPSGEMAFSPFLLNTQDKDRFIIGNVNRGVTSEFSGCRYGRAKKTCQNCKSAYFRAYDSDTGANKLHIIYCLLMLEAARKISARSRRNALFQDYVHKIENAICF